MKRKEEYQFLNCQKKGKHKIRLKKKKGKNIQGKVKKKMYEEIFTEEFKL